MNEAREEVREMMQGELSRAQWWKSSYSGNTGNCVEVAITASVVGVRDLKEPDGPKLVFEPDEWQMFLAGVRGGVFGV